MNCLAYALRFWENNPHYKLYYNSDHVINLPNNTDDTILSIATNYLPAEGFGYGYFSSSFAGLLDSYEEELLKKYFNKN